MRITFLILCFFFVTGFGLFAQTSYFVAPNGGIKLMDKFGVVSPRLKRLARTPKMSLPVDSEDGGAIWIPANVIKTQ